VKNAMQHRVTLWHARPDALTLTLSHRERG